ncbi:MAG: hypothetical protein Kow0047_09600 [Anaerolineae bacterium]
MDLADKMRDQMGKIEGFLAGLPGIEGYKEKELRREADRKVREMLAQLLEDQRARLTGLQLDLLSSGGLEWVDDLERAVGKLQLLIDQVKTAAYGYAGFFDALRVKEAELDRLAVFDRDMIQRATEVGERIDALAQAVEAREEIGPALKGLLDLLTELSQLWRHRGEAMHRAAE